PLCLVDFLGDFYFHHLRFDGFARYHLVDYFCAPNASHERSHHHLSLYGRDNAWISRDHRCENVTWGLGPLDSQVRSLRNLHLAFHRAGSARADRVRAHSDFTWAKNYFSECAG